MGERSPIEWTDASWTPIRARWFAPTDDGGRERIGWHCEHVSEGCRNCYAGAINDRLGTGLDFRPGNLFRPERVGYNNGAAKVFLDEAMLFAPLRWRRPRHIFVCSMTDLFGDWVPDAMIDRVFAVMALAPQHTFQVLTKRSARMRAYLTAERQHAVSEQARKTVEAETGLFPLRSVVMTKLAAAGIQVDKIVSPLAARWPLRNVWLGVSTEDQRRADERVPDLLATPAAVRFVSGEPLLGGIDFTAIACPNGCRPPDYCNRCHPDGGKATGTFDALATGDLHQIIVGGESGPSARPMHPNWARSIREQCAAAGTAFFFKQWGSHIPNFPHPSIVGRAGEIVEDPNGTTMRLAGMGAHSPAIVMSLVGKKAAGRLLDGVEHNGMPKVPA